MTGPTDELEVPLQAAAPDAGSFSGDLAKWIDVIEADNNAFRNALGAGSLAGWVGASRVLSGPRALRKAMAGPPRSGVDRRLQLPWLPTWPSLDARPVHDPRRFPWMEVLRQASADIRNELWQVCEGFSRSEYQADKRGEKDWNTYLFYSRGRARPQHLQACPRTREVLAEIPHNGFHVCFSALEPGGALTPHTGPTNASLTAHLGLAHCDRTSLWAGGQIAQYREDEVLVFDDSFVHWVQNDGTEKRYTLMFTFPHPELNLIERQLILQAIRIFG